MDFYLLDSNFADTGIYDAAGSGCPAEHLTIDPTVIADGTYYIFYDIYDTGNIDGGSNSTSDGLNNTIHNPFTIPITVHYSRSGGISGNFVQESQFAPLSIVVAGYQNPNSNFVVKIEKSNGVYTLSNSIPQVIATGKNTWSNIEATISQARINNGKL
jgi:hypothetical protein